MREQFVQVELRGRVRVLVVSEGVGCVEPLVELVDHALALGARDEHERVLVHRRAHGVVAGVLIVDHRTEVHPAEGVHPTGVLAGVRLEVPTDQPVEMRLTGADRTEQKLDPLFGSEAPSAGFHLVDELVDRLVDLSAVEDVLAVVEGVVRGERVLDDAAFLVVLGAVVVEHVRDALVSVPRDPRLLVQRVEVPVERAGFPEIVRDVRPVLLAEPFERVSVWHCI